LARLAPGDGVTLPRVLDVLRANTEDAIHLIDLPAAGGATKARPLVGYIRGRPLTRGESIDHVTYQLMAKPAHNIIVIDHAERLHQEALGWICGHMRTVTEVFILVVRDMERFLKVARKTPSGEAWTLGRSIPVDLAEFLPEEMGVAICEFSVGDEVVFTRMAKIRLADGKVVNVPAGTRGQVVAVTEEAGIAIYTMTCSPATAYYEPTFLVGADETEFLEGITLAKRITEAAWPGLNDQEIFDDDMPGFLRSDGGYLLDEPDSQGEYLLYRRVPWTDWQIEMHAYPGGDSLDAMQGIFRTDWIDGRECEQFTLMPADQDYTYVQVQKLANNRIRIYAYVPAEVEVDTRKRLVTIHLLCSVEFTEDGRMIVRDLPE
jgi:hypothetical protein